MRDPIVAASARLLQESASRGDQITRKIFVLILLLLSLSLVLLANVVLCGSGGDGHRKQESVIAVAWQHPIRVRQPVHPLKNRPFVQSCAAAPSEDAATKAQSAVGGAKGALSGAVLGGLIAGPFGAIWGASIGNTMDQNARMRREEERVEEERIAAMGLDKATLSAIQQCARELAEAEESLEFVKSSERSQREYFDKLDREMNAAYTAAEAAVRNGDEAAARCHLEKRAALKPKRAVAEADLTAATSRVATMESNLEVLTERATRIEQLISRNLVASKRKGSAQRAPELSDPRTTAFDDYSDPLEARFKELEGK